MLNIICIPRGRRDGDIVWYEDISVLVFMDGDT